MFLEQAFLIVFKYFLLSRIGSLDLAIHPTTDFVGRGFLAGIFIKYDTSSD